MYNFQDCQGKANHAGLWILPPILLSHIGFWRGVDSQLHLAAQAAPGTIMAMRSLVLLALLCAQLASAFYLPGVAPQASA
jgi:hypothetical protein